MEDKTPKLIEELYEAALQGDVSLLRDLLRRDPFLLHRHLPPSSNTSPLHVACNLGHTNFVVELLYHNPSRMEELDPNDKSSLLHLAAKNGHLELVKSLVLKNPSLCYARDMHGRTPVHVAAIKGQVHVLEELLRSIPDAARERVGLLLEKSGGDTIMHLCVRFNQLEALKETVRTLGDTQMLNATDVDGNTILHVAVANKRLEIVKFLLKDGRLKKNTKNSNGLTAMDVFTQSPPHFNSDVDDQLRSTLKRDKVLSSEVVNKDKMREENHLDWIEKPAKQRNTFMVVASLIATMAFQAGVNPPGGVWQDDNPSNQSNAPAPAPAPAYELPTNNTQSHVAGTSIIARKHPTAYTMILVCNSVGFILSMSSILLLISGFPCRRFSMFVIKTMLWMAISATTFCYILAAIILIPKKQSTSTEEDVIIFSILVWFCVMGLILIGHIIRLTVKFIKFLCKCCIPNHASKNIV